MPRTAIAVAAAAVLAIAGGSGVVAAAQAPGPAAGSPGRSLVVRGSEGDILTTVPLTGDGFSVSYRNSIYGTPAEERYTVLPDGRFRLVEIAADQLAVLEEYYAVPGAPSRAPPTDRRRWIVAPDPDAPTVLKSLSIAATDRGERTVHVHGRRPVRLWPLVADDRPFVVLDIEETP